jgi:hypothetical protein
MATGSATWERVPDAHLEIHVAHAEVNCQGASPKQGMTFACRAAGELP